MKRLFSLFIAVLTLLLCCVSALAAESSSPEQELDTDSDIYKKTALFVGDSICEASNEWGTGKIGWAGRIMSLNKMKGFNQAKSGASISDCRGENTVINQLKAQLKNKDEFDYVIMHGGVNDAWDEAPIGAITEGFDAKLDTTTFAGGLEATFKYAKQNFKNAYFGYIINFSLPAAKYGKLSDMSEYFTVAKQICEKWEIPYLDLYFNDEFNNKVMMTRSLKYLKDYIHPNPDGYDVLTPYINDWMKTIKSETEKLSAETSVTEETDITVSAVSEAKTEKSGNGETVIYIVCGIAIIAAAAVIFTTLKKGKEGKNQ